MKKICFVAYDLSVTGGVEQVTATLTNALCKDYEIHIYAIKNNGGEVAYQFDERIHYHEELYNVYRLREMITGVFNPFCDYVKKNKIDIVVLMETYAALIVSPTRFFTKAKYIFCDHGSLMNQWHQKDITAIRYWDALISHKIITLTEKNKEDYIRKFHTKRKKIDYIYNYIMPEVLDAKKEYSRESKQIISVGRFGKEKGYDMLVETARKVLPKHPDWEWHLYGMGETFDEIQKKAFEYGLGNQLIFKGNVKDAYKLYSEYAFLVLTSYREGLPLVLLEASAVGLPMVSFDIMTGPNEIITDGENGFLIPPYDCDKMAEVMEKLISDEALRIELSENTKKYVEKFECGHILKKWENLFEEI